MIRYYELEGGQKPFSERTEKMFHIWYEILNEIHHWSARNAGLLSHVA